MASPRAERNQVATIFIEQENQDQVAWVDDLLRRVDTQAHDQVVVLVLDHGVNNGHRLLQPLLPEADKHSVLPEWASGLGLRPHPEGGWYAETWRSPLELPGEGLGGYPGRRSLGTAILFLLLPGDIGADVREARVIADEYFAYHRQPGVS